MGKMDYWRLCDELSVVQAVLLIIGVNPDDFPSVLGCQEHEWPEKFSASLSALSYATIGGRLAATLLYKVPQGFGGKSTEEECWHTLKSLQEDNREISYHSDPDWDKSTIKVEDLKKWLSSRGVTNGFFFSEELGTGHNNYPLKLTAAIDAWRAVKENPELTKGKTVKQALINWLEKRADRYGLTKDDGSLNTLGIDEVAKVSNWAPKAVLRKHPVDDNHPKLTHRLTY
jgi:hypothetical protein